MASSSFLNIFFRLLFAYLCFFLFFVIAVCNIASRFRPKSIFCILQGFVSFWVMASGKERWLFSIIISTTSRIWIYRFIEISFPLKKYLPSMFYISFRDSNTRCSSASIDSISISDWILIYVIPPFAFIISKKKVLSNGKIIINVKLQKMFEMGRHPISLSPDFAHDFHKKII